MARMNTATPARRALSFPRLLRTTLAVCLACWIALAGARLFPSVPFNRDTALAARRGALSALPPVMLWAWERPEDLRFLDPQRAGVAFLAAELHLRGDEVAVRPRMQPLRVAEGAALVAVIRIESDPRQPPTLSPAQRRETLRAIEASARRPGLAAVQVDFDAVVSERPFYRALLGDLRGALPASLPISITALSSWCLGDRWLDGLPVDEAVPMLFRMGPDRSQVLARLARGGDFRAELCRQSLGLSTDEPLAQLPPGRRIYLFHPRAWDEASALAAIARTRELQ